MVAVVVVVLTITTMREIHSTVPADVHRGAIIIDLRVVDEPKLNQALLLMSHPSHRRTATAVKLSAHNTTSTTSLVIKEELAGAVGRMTHHLHVTDLLELLLLATVVWEAAQDWCVRDVRVHCATYASSYSWVRNLGC